MRPKRCGLAALTAACLASLGATIAMASPSDSLGDREVREELITQASDRCVGYKGAYADVLQGLDISLARSVLDHHVLVCPDPALDAASAVVWYGNHRAITWNPKLPQSRNVLDHMIRRMAKADDFPDKIEVFDVHDALVTGQLVPAFTTRCVDRKDCG